MMKSYGCRYTKYVIVFAAETFCRSPATYRFIRQSQTIILPAESKIRELLSLSLNDESLTRLFSGLKPEQRLVNILFDEVKLKESLLFTGGHIIGRAKDKEVLAKSALVIELVCHHGGPKYVLRVVPVIGKSYCADLVYTIPLISKHFTDFCSNWN